MCMSAMRKIGVIPFANERRPKIIIIGEKANKNKNTFIRGAIDKFAEFSSH